MPYLIRDGVRLYYEDHGQGLPVLFSPGEYPMTTEHIRLAEAREQQVPWKQWGPYLSEQTGGAARRRGL